MLRMSRHLRLASVVALPLIDRFAVKTYLQSYMNPALKDGECLGRGFNPSQKKDVNDPVLKDRVSTGGFDEYITKKTAKR